LQAHYQPKNQMALLVFFAACRVLLAQSKQHNNIKNTFQIAKKVL